VAAVQQGKADAAFVYASDIHAAEGLVQVPLTATLAPKAVTRFAVVVIAAAGDPVAAAAFARWLTNEAGQAALAPFGFDPPGSL
jgi:molybdate transport system substrate-binding protein